MVRNNRLPGLYLAEEREYRLKQPKKSKGLYRTEQMTTNPYQIVHDLRDLNERDVDSRIVFNWLSKQNENRNQPLRCRITEIADETGISREAAARAISDIAEITGDDVIGFKSEQMVTFMEYETCSIGVTAQGRGQLQQRPRRWLAAHAP